MIMKPVLTLAHVPDDIERLKEDVDLRDIRMAMAGSQPAYKMLYQRHVDDLFRFMTQFTDDRDQIADWVQQTFARAFQNLNTFEGRSAFRTWLFRIGINEMRQTMRRVHLEPEYIETETLQSYSDAPRSPADWISLRDQIRNLPERSKMVFLLYEVEGYSHLEISRMMGIAEGSSRSILTRVKNELRKHLSDL